jgi:hypothetical protein
MLRASLRPLAAWAIVFCALVRLTAGSPSGDDAAVAKRAVLAQETEAVKLLNRAAEAARAGDRKGFSRSLAEAATRIDELGKDGSPIPPKERGALRGAAAALRSRGKEPPRGFSAGESVRLLESSVASLRAPLDFQGSYSEPKVKEPAYGGHASAMGPPPAPLPGLASGSGAPSPVQFEEVPGPWEKTYCGGPTKDHILESGGSGIAIVDYDGDGLMDIYAVSAYELDSKRQRIPHKNALYHNLGGLRFENVAQKAGVDGAAWGSGVCAGDFNGDGKIDLYVTNWGPNFLYRNNGDGTFTEVAAASGVQAGGWSTGCTFFDAEGDGNLDLYVARYATVTWEDLEKAERTLIWRGGPKVLVGPVGIPGAADLFFKNRGDGTFVDATEAAGLADPARAYGFGVVATDYDDDGHTDLFVANDSNPNFLYHNLGDGRFESAGLLAGVALNGEGRVQAGMGVDAGDYDGDGLMDFVVSTFAMDTKTLYHNLGGGRFVDATQEAGLAAPTFERMGWGVAFLDADLDGWPDLFFAYGHIFPQVDDFPALKESFHQKSQLLLNEGGRFRDVSDSAGGGLQIQRSSRGLAVGDLDNDGDPDLVISNVDDVPTVLENRQKTGHHWIGLALRKPGKNPFCIGARVSLEAGGRRQSREVRSGGSYLSQSDLRALFGLGSNPGPVDVEVRLGAARWRFTGLKTDQYKTLVLREEDRLRK